MNNKEYKLRIGDIELIIYDKEKDLSGEIVKYYKNLYYRQEDKYKWDKNKEFAYPYPDRIDMRIHKSCFKNPETKYVISFIRSLNDEISIESVGNRFLELDKKDFNDYITLCKKVFEL